MPGPRTERPYLLDVSRLIWRAWRGKLPTGIDRVCQAYVEHFGARSRAVVQRGGFQWVLSDAHSSRLFELLLSAGTNQRVKLLRLAAAAWIGAFVSMLRPGSIYLNVGHTGLNEDSLPRWIASHQLRAVYLIHDLIPLSHPEYCRPGEAEKHGRRMNNVLASAAGIIGNSQATLDEMEAFAARQGKVMPPSVVEWISGGDFARGVEPKRLPTPHFVTIGTIEGRKNHQILLDAWRKIVVERGKNAPSLVIIGQRGWQADEVFEQLDNLGELRDHVVELDACDDRDLAGWIAGAQALLMPSFAEGFGLPVFEALHAGTAVIAADLPVYREIAGNIPTFAAPDDVEGWARIIGEFCDGGDELERQRVAMAGFTAPSWGSHFSTVESWLADL